MDSALVVFAKYPEAGNVKTKLALHIGEKNSAAFCKAMIKDLIKKHKSHKYDLIIAYSPKDKEKQFKKDYKADLYIPQIGENFGKRAMNAFKKLLKKYKKVVAVASDVPDLEPKQVHKAFMSLENVDVVVGPAADGSYYLVGMKKPIDLFGGVKGYYPEILEDTLRLIQKKNSSYALLEKKNDIDDVYSFRKLKGYLKKTQAPLTYELIKKIKV